MRTIWRLAAVVATALSVALPAGGEAFSQDLANNLFGSQKLAALSGQPKSYGFYCKGCCE